MADLRDSRDYTVPIYSARYRLIVETRKSRTCTGGYRKEQSGTDGKHSATASATLDNARATHDARRMAFDEATAQQAVERVASGESLSKACTALALSHATFYRHLETDQSLRENYARATLIRAERKADEVEELADQVAAGTLDPQAGRVAIDAKKWSAAILNRAKYGDKAALELTGANGSDLFAGMSKVELQAELVRRMSNPELLRALQAAGVTVAALPGSSTKADKG